MDLMPVLNSLFFWFYCPKATFLVSRTRWWRRWHCWIHRFFRICYWSYRISKSVWRFCMVKLNRVFRMYLRTLMPKQTEMSVNPHLSVDSLPPDPFLHIKVLTHTELQSLTSSFCHLAQETENAKSKHKMLWQGFLYVFHGFRAFEGFVKVLKNLFKGVWKPYEIRLEGLLGGLVFFFTSF